ncbi:MAG: PSD1 domain-containing protein [Planctomycetales bacterium]|nr:PSD1 domain-containing protein [Planctomycetales bacterium]
MTRPIQSLFLVLISSAAAPMYLPDAARGDSPEVDYARDIRPILSDNCFHCHGPDAKHREADLRLDLREGALADLGGYAAIVPGDAAQSELVARLEATEDEVRMPPPDSGKALTSDQVELVRRWIDQGADWPQHWSFVPPLQAELPDVTEKRWASNAIDRHVYARLASEGLEPSPAADRRTLARRLSLDLTGLPPSLEALHAFVKDQDENAYEHLVDRLLESPHYGERMALAWLDQARYADTNGYSIDGGRHMWLWRDWVINAYNANMPLDQFITEQLAGDLLPEATVEQQVATGFNRNHMITHEGGTIPEENLVNYAVDRVKTTAEVFLGLTMGCAQCHDHKYDPLTQTDFYRFFAFFNELEDRGLDGNSGVNAGPKIEAPTVLGRDEAEGIKLRLAEIEAKLSLPLASQADWEQSAIEYLDSRGRGLELHEMELLKISTPNRAVPDLGNDGSVLSLDSGSRSPSLLMRADQGLITGLRVEFYPHPQLPGGSLGHGNKQGLEGSFILSSFSASADALPSSQVDIHKQLPIRCATASNAHPDYPPEDCLDPRDHNGWSPHPHNLTKQHITFTFDEPIDTSQMPYITTLMVWGGGEFGGGAALTPGHFRVYAISGIDDGTSLPEDVQAFVRVNKSDRTEEQQSRLQAYYASIAPEYVNLRYERDNLEDRLSVLATSHSVMVMNSSSAPRSTHVLNRGQYDQPREEVTPGVPDCLPPLPEGAPANRLGLARWLIAPEHPLTARVAVNRIWQQFFGTGIVATSADFGSQGQPPSHPELLDYLAVDFVASGWDVKRLVKQIVMSATYRQASQVTPQLLRSDPNNRWLARGPRFRLQAEFVRDSALQVSGLLVDRIGGPSVNPYQPAGLWREISHFGSSPATAQVFVQDHGEKLYRRSMYTYWKRTVPPPSMVSFDAPNRELCTHQRATTNTPLQALVLLNDPQFVEASRALAQQMIQLKSADVQARIAFAFELATSRLPTAQETAILERAYARALADFGSDPQRALAYLGIGESDRDSSIDPVEHAAWMSVASTILNLSETITKG